jgi:predicted enzyme related to lactoylglutathione lyase
MQVERVDFVDVPTRDLDRAVVFYRDVLGLPQNPKQVSPTQNSNRALSSGRRPSVSR